MGRKKKIEKQSSFRNLRTETVQSVIAILCFVCAILLILASLNKAGFVGDQIYTFFSFLFGVGFYLLPIVLIALGVSFISSLKKQIARTQAVSSFILFLSGLGLIHILISTPETLQGGKLGYYIALPFLKLFDVYTSVVILGALVVISLLIMFDVSLNPKGLLFWRKNEEEDLEGDTDSEEDHPEETEPEILEVIDLKKETSQGAPKIKKPPEETAAEFAVNNNHRFGIYKEYVPPPLSLLERDKGKPVVGDIKANANIIKRTLQNFGITVEMDEVSIGPSVTRYALKPAEGVKLSRIVGLQNDLSLALAAHPLRIEAPIPGKSLVGIEMPNSTKTTVGLGTLLSSTDYQNSNKPLLVALGKGISGESNLVNIAKMPHLLIAGATGSGKSVTIHALITSLLYRNSPEHLKFIMIDPKRVELTLYNKIPHLLTPVITDAKKAILSLKWAGKEMDRRYDILESHSVRDIQSYHENILEPALLKFRNEKRDPEESAALPESMPYIVVIIDELADIMQTFPRELEASIVRLAQMSRAVGIHLMLSTQRPSVNVITGLIKANIPSRIALQVASQIDSRTILDMAGAEKLLGAGDMLYMSGEMSQPRRIQSAFVSETEVKKVVKYLSEAYQDELPGEIDMTTATSKNNLFEATLDDMASSEDEDDMYEEARQVVMEAGKASTSYIQRKLRIGYARAARLMDILEERGVIGPADGARPREILIKDSDNPSESTAIGQGDSKNV